MAKIVTANHLVTGDAVFLAEEGWTTIVGRACAAEGEDELAALEARARADEAANIVVAPYAVEVRRDGAAIVPVHIRERLRTLGPSVRPDLNRRLDARSCRLDARS